MGLLPIKKTREDYALETIRALFYGPPKIGKTTFLTQFDDLILLATEMGYKGLDVFKFDITSWKDFLDIVDEILAGKHKFRTIGIDTVDNLFKMCQDFISKKHKIDHPSDEQYGKGWDLLKTEFTRPILRLSVSKYGLIFISHSQETTIHTRHMETTKIIPTMSNSARKIINPFVDIIGYCCTKTVKGAKEGEFEEKRVIKFDPSESIEAGDRTGFMPDIIPLSYKKFKACFE